MKEKLQKINDFEWLLPKEVREGMNVDAKIIASEKMLDAIEEEAINQLTNVAMLPGVIDPVVGLPDMHWGYGIPMGAVSAFDENDGIISSGLCGFDINCLSGDTKILHEFGYTKPIKNFEKSFHDDRLTCFNPTTKIKKTDIALFMKKKTDKKVFRIKTEYGNEITASADHPLFTKQGMVKIEDLKINDEISFFPFKGIQYEEPEEFTIVNIGDIKKGSSKKELIEKGLLPLNSNNYKLPYLLKLLGFALGDGSARRNRGTYGEVAFYSKNIEDLEEVKEDILRIGYPSSLSSRKRDHSINTFYGNIKFEAIENSLRMNKQSLFDLLEAMGLVLGDKVHVGFKTPEYILKLPLWQKRLFLSSFFGAELSSPKTVTKHGYNFYGPVLSLNKSEKLLEDIDLFLKEIKLLLNEFGVESNIINIRKEYEGKKGITYRARLQISSKPKNLITFFSEIGYDYNKERKFLANIATAYLLTKQKIYLERKQAIERVNEIKDKKSPKEIFKELVSKNVNKRFLTRTLYENRKDVRIAFNFQKFEDFLKEKTEGLGKTGQIWAKITEKEEIDFDDYVYDFTVMDKNHNFVANNLVVSNCGINLIRTSLTYNEIKDKINELVKNLYEKVPVGVGSKGKLKLTDNELNEVLTNGSKWAVDNGYGTKDDLKNTEENGCMLGADPSKVSKLAKERGRQQLGTLGAGNHFLELQKITHILDEAQAKKWGIKDKNQITIMLHCGSRGLGHQVATDYLKEQEQAVKKYNIKLPDPQLACAPAQSKEGQDFFAAMKCAVNYSFANRQVMTHWIREAFEKTFNKEWKEMDMNTLYGICHNVIKFEKIKGKNYYIHRKGATRSYPDLPVLIAGSMGTSSYLLKGTKEALDKTFGSSAHGAGRAMSRNKALSQFRGQDVVKALAEKGIVSKSPSLKGMAEESPESYKDVEEVINSVKGAKISLPVARMVPVGVIKG